MKFAKLMEIDPKNPMQGLGSWPEDKADKFGKGKMICFFIVEHPDIFVEIPCNEYLKRKWKSADDAKDNLLHQLSNRGIDSNEVTVDCKLILVGKSDAHS